MRIGFQIDKQGKLKVSEADIERTCTEWLALDGWRCLKTNPCSDRARGKGFGEVGMADCLYIRYDLENISELLDDFGGALTEKVLDSLSQVMWIEWKSRTGRNRDHQRDWQAAEGKRGALVVAADVDFPASIEGFQFWYRQSGLARRLKAL